VAPPEGVARPYIYSLGCGVKCNGSGGGAAPCKCARGVASRGRRSLRTNSRFPDCFQRKPFPPASEGWHPPIIFDECFPNDAVLELDKRVNDFGRR